MKKIILLLLLVLPMMSFAGSTKEDKHAAKYLKGAVPVENGIVTYKKSFKVPGQNEQQLFDNMLFYIKDNLVEKGIVDAHTRLISDGSSDGVISARVEEWLVFTKKFLNIDKTRFRYQITATISGNTVNLIVTQISYLYGEEWEEIQPTGNGGTIYRAEEWITDEVALNKKGNKVLPLSGKFRRKTIDRVEEIFENAMDMFEENAKKQQEEEGKKVPKRQFVVE